jgi:predicted ArsR family transcriptional regulator
MDVDRPRDLDAMGELGSLNDPIRNYALLAGLLADAITADRSGTVRTVVACAARQAGRAEAGEHGADLMGALVACGYWPAAGVDGDIELRNRPFHHVAQRHTELVCELNQHLVQGVLDATGQEHASVLSRPQPGRCCVMVHAGHADRIPEAEEDGDE